MNSHLWHQLTVQTARIRCRIGLSRGENYGDSQRFGRRSGMELSIRAAQRRAAKARLTGRSGTGSGWAEYRLTSCAEHRGDGGGAGIL